MGNNSIKIKLQELCKFYNQPSESQAESPASNELESQPALSFNSSSLPSVQPHPLQQHFSKEDPSLPLFIASRVLQTSSSVCFMANNPNLIINTANPSSIPSSRMNHNLGGFDAEGSSLNRTILNGIQTQSNSGLASSRSSAINGGLNVNGTLPTVRNHPPNSVPNQELQYQRDLQELQLEIRDGLWSERSEDIVRFSNILFPVQSSTDPYECLQENLITFCNMWLVKGKHIDEVFREVQIRANSVSQRISDKFKTLLSRPNFRSLLQRRIGALVPQKHPQNPAKRILFRNEMPVQSNQTPLTEVYLEARQQHSLNTRTQVNNPPPTQQSRGPRQVNFRQSNFLQTSFRGHNSLQTYILPAERTYQSEPKTISETKMITLRPLQPIESQQSSVRVGDYRHLSQFQPIRKNSSDLVEKVLPILSKNSSHVSSAINKQPSTISTNQPTIPNQPAPSQNILSGESRPSETPLQSFSGLLDVECSASRFTTKLSQKPQTTVENDGTANASSFADKDVEQTINNNSPTQQSKSSTQTIDLRSFIGASSSVLKVNQGNSQTDSQFNNQTNTQANNQTKQSHYVRHESPLGFSTLSNLVSKPPEQSSLLTTNNSLPIKSNDQSLIDTKEAKPFFDQTKAPKDKTGQPINKDKAVNSQRITNLISLVQEKDKSTVSQDRSRTTMSKTNIQPSQAGSETSSSVQSKPSKVTAASISKPNAMKIDTYKLKDPLSSSQSPFEGKGSKPLLDGGSAVENIADKDYCLCGKRVTYNETDPDIFMCIHCEKYFHKKCLRKPINNSSRSCTFCHMKRIVPLKEVSRVLFMGILRKGRRRHQVHFNLPDSQIKSKIQVRCFRIKETTQNFVLFPDGCSFSLNQAFLRDFIPLHRQSSLKYRKDEPWMINGALVRPRANKLVINEKMMGKQCVEDRLQPENHLFGLFVVEERSIDYFMNQISLDNVLSFHESRAILDESFSISGRTGSDQITCELIKIPLTCPLTCERISIPMRGSFCTHFQCLDLRNFVSMTSQSTNPRWVCPICRSPLYDFRVDCILLAILNEYKQSNVSEVMLCKNGDFTVFVGTQQIKGRISNINNLPITQLKRDRKDPLGEDPKKKKKQPQNTAKPIEIIDLDD